MVPTMNTNGSGRLPVSGRSSSTQPSGLAQRSHRSVVPL
jgi:hypothetical protein